MKNASLHPITRASRFLIRRGAICALLAIAVAACGTALYAQDNMGQGQAGQSQMGPGGGHRGMMSPDQRLQHLTKMLKLTSDQQAKIKPMLEQEQTQMQSLHQDTSMSQQDRWAKAKTIRQSTNEQIKSALTPDQQTKFTQMQERQMEHMGHGGMGQGQPQQAPPQQ